MGGHLYPVNHPLCARTSTTNIGRMATGTRIRSLVALRSALLEAPAGRTASGLRDALLRYDARELIRSIRWMRFVANTPFAQSPQTRVAPYAATLMDTDDLRVRLLHWRPGLVMPFHDHPGFDLVAMRVLGGSPLQEHVRSVAGATIGGQSIDGTVRRELVAGDVSVIPGTGAEHRIQVKYPDTSSYTLSVELPA